MGQYDRHVFVCTSGETCPTQGDTERYVKILREGVRRVGRQGEMRINKSGCFSQCGHGPMIVVYPENIWYAGVQESDLEEILTSHLVGGQPVERLRYDPGVPGPNQVPAESSGARVSGVAHQEARPPDATWHHVCRSDDVPANGMKQFSVGGIDLLIINAGDDFVAYQALCPHETVPLEQGVHDGCVLTCLEHLWQFDVRTGAPLGDAETGLKGYRLKKERGELYVGLDG